MFLPSRALSGSRRHRLAVGSILTPFLTLVGVALSATAISVSGQPGPLLGFGSAAFSAYAVAWWSARYWYAAFQEGRSARPVPEPHPWPWALPPVVLSVVFAVTGIGAVQDGKTAAAVFSLVFATVLLLPVVIFLAVMLTLRGQRSGPPATGAGQAASPQAPQRPYRAWGTID
ncbi:hypothetical protein [Streptomyces sp. Ru73]|uniref:hypothetical protein n=1 Tax=Streptomyces sp. Ru73 TaxID=2080748 RepID=UPI0015E2BB53|nr:hypothetical protein [Streptomyces sp. Ru73]